MKLTQNNKFCRSDAAPLVVRYVGARRSESRIEASVRSNVGQLDIVDDQVVRVVVRLLDVVLIYVRMSDEQILVADQLRLFVGLRGPFPPLDAQVGTGWTRTLKDRFLTDVHRGAAGHGL